MPMIQNNKQKIIAWCFYDFANSAFPTIMLTVAFGVFYKSVIISNPNLGDWLWGLTLSLSYLLIALSAPILGTLSDIYNFKRRMLSFFCCMSALASVLLFFSGSGTAIYSSILIIMANYAFATSNVFYNAFLPLISTPKNIGRISGYGWALGYIGGLICLGICFPFISPGFDSLHITKYKLSFVVTGIFYFLFAMPAMIFLKETTAITSQNFKLKFAIKAGYLSLGQTWRDVSKHRPIVRFLTSYFFFNDAITTVISYAGIYALSTLSFTMREVMFLFILLQVFAFIGAFAGGYASDYWGPKKILILTILIWIINIIGGYFCVNKFQFWLIGISCGLVIGASQSIARALMGLLSPPSELGKFYGLYALCGKFSAILGPLVFGFVSVLTSSQRLALLSILPFFIISLIVLLPLSMKQKIESG